MQNFLFVFAAVVLFSLPVRIVNAQEGYFGHSSPETVPAVPATPSPVVTVTLTPPAVVAPPVPLPAGSLRIVTALWGTGRVYADVTAIINEGMRQPGLELSVDPVTLKGDPVVGTRKELITVFEWNGLRYVMALPEEARLGIAVMKEFVRTHSIVPPAGPALVLKTKPRNVEQLKNFLVETSWEMGPENGTPNWQITFCPNGVVKVRGDTMPGAWNVENATTIRLWNKDFATFNGDFTRFRAMGDDTAYSGLLKQ